ncbi:putative xylitol oxidase [Microbacterium oleivorans]|uniref:FAD-binding protein n=1 Tax=Microbacterium oleivorans TaxID=273677 RepID=UPI000975DDF1|nr:FAD-binding protein [Microbacterium oleivorans]AZS45229.1 putative xylitol oxidase [Microbacterium oleivorans]
MSDGAGENWSRNIRYSAERFVAPRTVDELREVVAASDSVKALGSRHSFTRIADTSGTLVSTAELDLPVQVDAAQKRVRVGGGVRYGELAQELDRQGWALANLASLPHISVAGAVSTGTHGSGVANRSLAAAVTGLDLVTSTGDLVRISEEDGELAGAVVGLGALGIVTTVELAIEPTYEIAQTVYENVPLEAVRKAFDVIAGSAYSVSLFTTFRDEMYVDQVWRKERTDAAATPIPASLRDREAAGALHPLPGVSAASCTVQGGKAGRWLDRLPHFRLEFTPSNGEELQSEFLVPFADAVGALDAVHELADRLKPVLQVCEVRTIAGDELWLSPSSGRDSVAFHFTWTADEAGVAEVLPELEAALARFDARPHWGKVFTPRDPAELYPRWADFVALQRRFDPRGAFVNEYLRALGL